MNRLRLFAALLLLLTAAGVAGADAGFPATATPKWSTLSTRDTVVGGLLLCAAAACLGLWAVAYPRAAAGVVLVLLGLPALLICLLLVTELDVVLWGATALLLAATALFIGVRLLRGSGPAFRSRGALLLAGGIVCLVLGIAVPMGGMEWETPRRPRPPRPNPPVTQDAEQPPAPTNEGGR